MSENKNNNERPETRLDDFIASDKQFFEQLNASEPKDVWNEYGVQICRLCNRPLKNGTTSITAHSEHGSVHTPCLQNYFEAKERLQANAILDKFTDSEKGKPLAGGWQETDPYLIAQQKKLLNYLNETYPTIALKLRFVLMNGAIILQALKIDGKLLGIGEGVSKWKNFDLKIYADGEESDLCFAEDVIGLNGTGVSICRTFHKDSKDLFLTCIMPALIKFAENNAFHGNEKPVEYLEKTDNCYILHRNPVTKPYSFEVPFEVIDTLERVIDHKILPFERKPMFAHKWRKVLPFECSPDEYDSLAAEIGSGYCAEIAIEFFKEKQKDLPEIWEFTMAKLSD